MIRARPRPLRAHRGWLILVACLFCAAPGQAQHHTGAPSYLQKRLVALAQSGDTSTRKGLLALLRVTVEALLAS